MLLNKLTHIPANRLVRMEKVSWEENLCSQISQAGALPVNMKISPWAHCPKILTISNMVDSKIVLQNGSLVYTRKPKNSQLRRSQEDLFGGGVFLFVCFLTSDFSSRR